MLPIFKFLAAFSQHFYNLNYFEGLKPHFFLFSPDILCLFKGRRNRKILAGKKFRHL